MLDMERQTSLNLQVFYARMATVRVLREHHLWQTVRLLFADLSGAPIGMRRRLEFLVLSDAMLDAVMLLTALGASGRSLRMEGARGWASRCAHQDLAAAILGSLIVLCLRAPASSRAVRTVPSHPDWKANRDEI